MKLGITGHRARYLTLPTVAITRAIADAYMDIGNVDFVYQGMADGADLLSAAAAWSQEIPFAAIIPYAGHQGFMSSEWWQQMWAGAKRDAAEVEILSDAYNYPGPWVFHNRDKYVVDHSDEMLAIWDGRESGGTFATVKLARRQKKPIHILDPQTLELTLAPKTL